MQGGGASPPAHNPRDDRLEITLVEAIGVPTRKDGSPRRPFISAVIPSTEQRWPLNSYARVNPFSQTFFLSVAERQDHAIQFSMWDIRENKDADDEHNKKLLGQFGIPLYYIGWKWIDAKMKVKAANKDNESKYAGTYVRARMRLIRGNKSVESLAAITEEMEVTPKTNKEKKKFWRHTRDMGKRSPTPLKLNEFLSVDTLSAIHEESDDDTKAKDDMSISQPVRTISINADSDSGSEDDIDRPPAKHGNALTKRLSRDFGKLRHLLTNDSHDRSHDTADSSNSKSPRQGKKFWTISRQSQAQLEVNGAEPRAKQDTSRNLSSIDWKRTSQDDSALGTRTRSDGSSKKKTKREIRKEKKERKQMEKKSKEGTMNGAAASSDQIEKIKKNEGNRLTQRLKRGDKKGSKELRAVEERKDESVEREETSTTSSSGSSSGEITPVEVVPPKSDRIDEEDMDLKSNEPPPTNGDLHKTKRKKGKKTSSAGASDDEQIKKVTSKSKSRSRSRDEVAVDEAKQVKDKLPGNKKVTLSTTP